MMLRTYDLMCYNYNLSAIYSPAAFVAYFCLFFKVQRELDMGEIGELSSISHCIGVVDTVLPLLSAAWGTRRRPHILLMSSHYLYP